MQVVSKKPPLTLSVTQEADGLYVTSSGAVSEFVFEVFPVSGSRVLASAPVSGERLKLRLQNAQGNPLAEGYYLYIGTSKIADGTLVKYFGRLILQSGQAEMEDSSAVLGSYEKHYFAQRILALQDDAKQTDIDQEFSAFQQNVKTAVEFFELAVKLMPENAEALLGQGFATAAAAGLTVSQMTDLTDPPTPAPPSPPPGRAGPRRLLQARQPEIQRAGLLRAMAAFQQAAQLSDCQSRAEAWLFMAALYVTLNETDNARAWRLKSATTDCASAAPTRSMAWYSLAAENWQCANEITERYTDQKRAMYRDPWYYRQITSAADQAKFATCLAQGLDSSEKALALEPNNSKAVFYQSLLYREKQKTAKLKAERLKYKALAEKVGQRAMELFKRQSEKQQ